MVLQFSFTSCLLGFVCVCVLKSPLECWSSIAWNVYFSAPAPQVVLHRFIPFSSFCGFVTVYNILSLMVPSSVNMARYSFFNACFLYVLYLSYKPVTCMEEYKDLSYDPYLSSSVWLKLTAASGKAEVHSILALPPEYLHISLWGCFLWAIPSFTPCFPLSIHVSFLWNHCWGISHKSMEI